MTALLAWRIAALPALIALGLTAPQIRAVPVANDGPAGEQRCQWLNRFGQPDITPAAIDWLESCLVGLPSTKRANSTEQGYTKDRQKLHNNIIKKARSGKPCITTGRPVAILTGGPPGAGKTTWLKRHIPSLVLQSSYRIDADEVREDLPEYQGWNASATQDEVRDIVDQQLEAIAKPCQLNVIYDGTMARADRYLTLIPTLKGMGYRVFLVQVVIPEAISQRRVLDRYQATGRFVPRSIVKAFYDQGAAVFRQLAPSANGSIQVDGLTGRILRSQGDPLPRMQPSPWTAPSADRNDPNRSKVPRVDPL